MGMAASQARYLALVARKSNCEYEGQQINQARLSLANQSADLFNQMMGLQVPKTPSKSDYTYTVYSFSDGDNTYTMDKWNHLADESDGYNYSVEYHYNTTENVGFQKYKRDPQVQFSHTAPTSTTIPADEIKAIKTALDDMETKRKIRDDAAIEYKNTLSKASKIETYEDKSTLAAVTAEETTSDTYTVRKGTSAYSFSKLNATTLNEIKDYLDALVQYGAFKKEDLGNVDAAGNCDYSNVYYDPNDTKSIALAKDLAALAQSEVGGTLPIYHTVDPTPQGIASVAKMKSDVDAAFNTYRAAENQYELSKTAYEMLNVPSLLGNTKLVAIGKDDMTADVAAAITKIIKQMDEDGISTDYLKSCFGLSIDGTYNADTYTGGLFSFDYTTSTFYTTYYDLYDSALSGRGVNNIDDQVKMAYYGTSDTEVKKDLHSRALIEKDKSGRFTSIRLEDDSFVYALKAETQTDDIGYEDAMNQSTYEKALYDKKVQEINAQTSLIQIQDKNLELRLKQLDTEQNALATEIDAVSKVVKDNVEKSFKTFGG